MESLEAINGHGFRFHKVESMLDEKAAHGQPIARFGDCFCLLVGPKMAHVVVSKILLKMNGLECVWKENVNAWNFMC